MSPTSEKKSKPTYAEFIGSLQLNTIYLKESACEIDRGSFWKNEGQSITYKFSAKSGSIEQNSFDASAHLDLSVVADKTKNTVLKISVTYDFHVHTELASKEFVSKFCEAEIRLIAWPYFREYVSEISSRMYIPPIILPLSDKKEE